MLAQTPHNNTALGNEYGITNVSSKGKVAITVIPPKQCTHISSSVPSTCYIGATFPNSLPVASPTQTSTTTRSAGHVGDAYSHPASSHQYNGSKRVLTGNEQSELDEILKELLGDSHTETSIKVEDCITSERKRITSADGSTTTIEKKTYAPAHVTYAPAHVSENCSSKKTEMVSPVSEMHVQRNGSTWLEQQQRKLSQRHQSQDRDDSTQRRVKAQQLVSELKSVQLVRGMSEDECVEEGFFRTEKDVFVQQEPSAYTVVIRPDERNRKVETTEPEVNLKKQTITNISHAHHNHYNFKEQGLDEADCILRQTLEEQQRRIAQLEEELHNVKLDLAKRKFQVEASSPPPRPPKSKVREEEEEVFSLKPVAIANLESGTGTAFFPHVVSASHHPYSPVVEPVNTHVAHSQFDYGKTYVYSGTLNGYGNGFSGSSPSPQQTAQSFPTQPASPYRAMSPVMSPTSHFSDCALQQRQILETRQVQQQTHQQGTGTLQTAAVQPMNSFTLLNRQHINTQYGYSQTQQNGYVANDTQSPDGTLQMNLNTSEARYATIGSPSMTGNSTINIERSESSSLEPHHLTSKFVKDTSKFWYKPNIGRDEAVSLLKDASPGMFIVRDSNSFPGAFGLAVKVAHLPPNVQVKPGSDPSVEHVRFFLIEPTAKGVKLKGCNNEPVFASLAALIYQHTITPLALPCKLVLPDADQLSPNSKVEIAAGNFDSTDASQSETISSASELLKHGAACSVLYVNNIDTESLTGPQALSRAIHQTFSKGTLDTTIATFKVSADGITITDNHRKLFFRQHFSKESVSYCGLDPADRRFNQTLDDGVQVKEAKIFGFVAKKKGGNQCVIMAELDPEQPATAIVNFITKVMMDK